MVIILDALANYTRKWTFNDRVNQHYFGRVRLNESPLRLKLIWKRDDNSLCQLVGVFELDLNALLEARYIREEQDSPGVVILRFQRTDNRIQIATRRADIPLDIGTIIL